MIDYNEVQTNEMLARANLKSGSADRLILADLLDDLDRSFEASLLRSDHEVVFFQGTIRTGQIYNFSVWNSIDTILYSENFVAANFGQACYRARRYICRQQELELLPDPVRVFVSAMRGTGSISISEVTRRNSPMSAQAE